MFTMKPVFDLSAKIAIIALPLLVGCADSRLTDIDMPASVIPGEPFEVSVTHEFQNRPEWGSSQDGYYFVITVPDDWTAQPGASYSGTIGGGAPLELEAAIVAGPRASDSELLDLISTPPPGCTVSVSLREGPTLADNEIALLYATTDSVDMTPRGPVNFDLSGYQGDTVFVVLESTSCDEGPMGLFVDQLSLVANAAGNLIGNASFESALDSWNLTGESCAEAALEEGATTVGAGQWFTPAPTNGDFAYTADALSPGECLTVQAIDVPGNAGAATLSGAVGSNYSALGSELSTIFSYTLMDLRMPTAPAGYQLIWFETEAFDALNDLEAGDGGTLTVSFVASSVLETEVEVRFFHGYFTEYYDEILNVIEDGLEPDVGPVSLLNAPSARSNPWAFSARPQAAQLGGLGLVQAAAAPPEDGYIAASQWFVDIDGEGGGDIFIQAIAGVIMVLADPNAIAAPIPAMGGVMLVLLASMLAGIGMHRRRRSKV